MERQASLRRVSQQHEKGPSGVSVECQWSVSSPHAAAAIMTGLRVTVTRAHHVGVLKLADDQATLPVM